ncbi:MAG TPA: surface-adhesin E family protein [Methylophilaceae bacterium]|jgi:hypothetical protein
MQINNKKTQRSTSVKIAGLTLLLIATAVQAADWQEFRGRAVPGATVYRDDNSVQIDRDTVVEGWVKIEYSTPKNIGGHQVISRTTHRAVNCSNGRYWVMEDWLNVSDGSDPIPLSIGDNAQEWQKAAPSSEAEMALDALCYSNKSTFGTAWDSVKESYESPQAQIKDVGPDDLVLLDAQPQPGDIQFKAWAGDTAIDSDKVSQKGEYLIVTKDKINFIDWDNELQIFTIHDLPLANISRAALVRGGNYEQLKQIQLITTTGKTVISFSTGENGLAEDVFAKLMKAGIPQYSTSHFVHGYRITQQPPQ